METRKEFMTAKEVAEYIGFSISWVRQAVSKGTITCYKPNQKTLFFKKTDIDNYIFRNKVSAKKEIASKIAARSYFRETSGVVK